MTTFKEWLEAKKEQEPFDCYGCGKIHRFLDDPDCPYISKCTDCDRPLIPIDMDEDRVITIDCPCKSQIIRFSSMNGGFYTFGPELTIDELFPKLQDSGYPGTIRNYRLVEKPGGYNLETNFNSKQWRTKQLLLRSFS